MTGRVLDATVALYRARPGLLFVLAAGVVLPYELIVLAATGRAPLAPQHGAASLLLTPLDLILVPALISALHVRAVAELRAGRQPELAVVVRESLGALPRVALTGVLVFVFTFVGFILLFVPGVIAVVRWSVAVQVSALEGVGPQDALKRTQELTREHFWPIAALLLAVGAAGAVVTLPPTLLIGDDTNVLTVLCGLVVRTATASVTALTSAALYFELLEPHAPASVATTAS